MLNEWNPENIVNQVLQKQQFYVINSVLTNKVLDCDEQNGHVLCLNEKQKDKDSQQFTFIKKDNGYLIQSKTGGYVTMFKEGDKQKLYLDKKIKNQQSQLFKISTKIGQKGQRIETLNKRAIGTFQSDPQKKNWKSVVLSEQNSEQNQLWNFSDPHA